MKVVYQYHLVSPTGEELELITSAPKNFKYTYGARTLAKKMRAFFKRYISCPEVFEKTCIVVATVIDPNIPHVYVFPKYIFKRVDYTQSAMATASKITYRYF